MVQTTVVQGIRGVLRLPLRFASELERLVQLLTLRFLQQAERGQLEQQQRMQSLMVVQEVTVVRVVAAQVVREVDQGEVEMVLRERVLVVAVVVERLLET